MKVILQQDKDQRNIFFNYCLHTMHISLFSTLYSASQAENKEVEDGGSVGWFGCWFGEYSNWWG
jgi:membrane protein involved in colicin uptake